MLIQRYDLNKNKSMNNIKIILIMLKYKYIPSNSHGYTYSYSSGGDVLYYFTMDYYRFCNYLIILVSSSVY